MLPCRGELDCVCARRERSATRTRRVEQVGARRAWRRNWTSGGLMKRSTKEPVYATRGGFTSVPLPNCAGRMKICKGGRASGGEKPMNRWMGERGNGDGELMARDAAQRWRTCETRGTKWLKSGNVRRERQKGGRAEWLRWMGQSGRQRWSAGWGQKRFVVQLRAKVVVVMVGHPRARVMATAAWCRRCCPCMKWAWWCVRRWAGCRQCDKRMGEGEGESGWVGVWGVESRGFQGVWTGRCDSDDDGGRWGARACTGGCGQGALRSNASRPRFGAASGAERKASRRRRWVGRGRTVGGWCKEWMERKGAGGTWKATGQMSEGAQNSRRALMQIHAPHRAVLPACLPGPALTPTKERQRAAPGLTDANSIRPLPYPLAPLPSLPVRFPGRVQRRIQAHHHQHAASLLGTV
ncbi:hypothetical protein BDY17DRAFT_195746 [Neohortaea acidophila]|uniref:Uncharacterized protein n=1 Tax=Neohortaea acidophila TaxID=245834 RepID=A0A6A6PLC3_9PEZI|nr:uncharacterized protein BDY17DRAFT_195746 [Neohortaea acidophila]KAF2480616.1 hypothetical protein BDY17DRAFT_195746 [Neohortaea acidophila]